MYCTLAEAIEEIKVKKILIIQDHGDREDEGDLYLPAQYATPEIINFMITYGKGLLCIPITPSRAQRLGLQLMVPENENKEYTKCNFTVSVDAKEGIATGISAFDRARTIKVLSHPQSAEDDLVSPGHVFPLVAKAGLLNERQGHTEAAIELAIQAKLDPSGVICEIIGDNGEMLRGDDLKEFAQRHTLKIITIDSLIKGNVYAAE